MSWQLVRTSVPQGLVAGSNGFCTVARSRDLSPSLTQTLETISGYRRLPNDPAANPVALSHVILENGGFSRRVVSRIADAGLDHTGRANKIAHHIVLSESDLEATSPESIFSARRLFRERWEEPPRYFDEPTPLPPKSISSTLCPCPAWTKLGDAGWAGYIASTVLSARQVVLVARPGLDILPLFLEAVSVLTDAKRWDATFSTYFTQAFPGVRCQWKAVYAGTPEAASYRALPNALVVDLTTGRAPNLNAFAQTETEKEFIAFARAGERPAAPAPTPVYGLAPESNDLGLASESGSVYGLAQESGSAYGLAQESGSAYGLASAPSTNPLLRRKETARLLQRDLPSDYDFLSSVNAGLAESSDAVSNAVNEVPVAPPAPQKVAVPPKRVYHKNWLVKPLCWLAVGILILCVAGIYAAIYFGQFAHNLNLKRGAKSNAPGVESKPEPERGETEKNQADENNKPGVPLFPPKAKQRRPTLPPKAK